MESIVSVTYIYDICMLFYDSVYKYMCKVNRLQRDNRGEINFEGFPLKDFKYLIFSRRKYTNKTNKNKKKTKNIHSLRFSMNEMNKENNWYF